MQISQTQFSSFRNLASIWAGAFILCIPAFQNNFPFLYADTGTYIAGGFQGHVSDIRPLTYGVFMRHVSLMESVWLVVFVQALSVSWSIHLFFSRLSSGARPYWPLVTIGVLTLMTGVGEVAGMLMPDIFTAVMLLSAALLLFGRSFRTWQVIVLSVLVWISVASHHSNAYIITLVVGVFGIAEWFRRWRWRQQNIPLRRIALVASLILAGYFTIPVLHQSYSGEFFWSKAKSIFLTNRVNQMGLLKPFLRENCGQKNYRLCASLEEIPFDLLWDADSPMRKSGGMAANDEEYRLMLRDFFSDAGYVRKFAIKTLENGVLQFFTVEGQLIFKEREEGYPYKVFQEALPEYIPPIRRSMQYQMQWDSHPTQIMQRILLFCSGIYLLSLFLFRLPAPPSNLMYTLGFFILLGLVANAFICGGISMVDMRFQYRVVWLIPFFAIWVLASQMNSLNNKSDLSNMP